MEIESHSAWNPDAPMKFKVAERLNEAFSRTDSAIGHLCEIRPQIASKYIEALERRLRGAIKHYTIDPNSRHIEDIVKKLTHLKKYPELSELVFHFVCNRLKLDEHALSNEEIEVSSYSHAMAHERLNYHIGKSLADLLGDESAIAIWKQMVGLRLRDQKVEFEERMKEREGKGEKHPNAREGIAQAVARWTETGLGDFTIATIDDHKVLCRFDKCVTHEVLRGLDDPDWAYLTSCYIGDAPEFNSFGTRLLRRTQTLHHGAFCDELYWDIEFYTDPEQPSLEYTRKLGKV
ncbi:MAG: hypothetical protein ACW99U_14480 [Candidatus Thorarchaeota archaeon]